MTPVNEEPPARAILFTILAVLANVQISQSVVTYIPVYVQAYTSLCDLLIFFAEHLASVHHGGGGGGAGAAAMRSLVLEPDAPLLDMLNDFIQEFVFVQHNYGMYCSTTLHYMPLLTTCLSSLTPRLPERSK